jgi:hypothetical protein
MAVFNIHIRFCSTLHYNFLSVDFYLVLSVPLSYFYFICPNVPNNFAIFYTAWYALLEPSTSNIHSKFMFQLTLHDIV